MLFKVLHMFTAKVITDDLGTTGWPNYQADNGRYCAARNVSRRGTVVDEEMRPAPPIAPAGPSLRGGDNPSVRQAV
jgi:hypothetical protein